VDFETRAAAEACIGADIVIHEKTINHKWSRPKKSTGGGRECFTCKKPGHFARECPNENNPNFINNSESSNFSNSNNANFSNNSNFTSSRKNSRADDSMAMFPNKRAHFAITENNYDNSDSTVWHGNVSHAGHLIGPMSAQRLHPCSVAPNLPNDISLTLQISAREMESYLQGRLNNAHKFCILRLLPEGTSVKKYHDFASRSYELNLAHICVTPTHKVIVLPNSSAVKELILKMLGNCSVEGDYHIKCFYIIVKPI
jgi:hypothetical protein